MATATNGPFTHLRGRLTISVEESAALRGVSRASEYEAARKGKLCAQRVGRRWIVPTVALLRDLGLSDLHIAAVLGIEIENDGDDAGDVREQR